MHRIVLSGIKHCGKSTVGWSLASRQGLFFADLDDLIIRDSGEYSSIRELFRDKGKEGFQNAEVKSLEHFLLANREKSFVLSLGGGTIENPAALDLLESGNVKTYYLHAEEDVLFERIAHGGIPPFLEGPDPRARFHTMYLHRSTLYSDWADFRIDTSGKTPQEITEEIAAL